MLDTFRFSLCLFVLMFDILVTRFSFMWLVSRDRFKVESRSCEHEHVHIKGGGREGTMRGVLVGAGGIGVSNDDDKGINNGSSNSFLFY